MQKHITALGTMMMVVEVIDMPVKKSCDENGEYY